MKNFVRQFKIENASGNMLVKAEILLEKLIGKGNFSLNKEKLLLTTTFKNDFEIDTKIAEIIDLIKSIDEDIEITERNKTMLSKSFNSGKSRLCQLCSKN